MNKKPFENIVGQEEMLVTSFFSFSNNVFYPLQKEFLFLSYIDFCCLQMLSMWTCLKICHLVKGSNLRLFGEGLHTVWVQHNMYSSLCLLH